MGLIYVLLLLAICRSEVFEYFFVGFGFVELVFYDFARSFTFSKSRSCLLTN